MTPAFRRLLQELSRLAGVGPKTAQRVAFQILSMKKERVKSLADALMNAREKIGRCKRCFNIAEGPLCYICMNEKRVHHLLCVVERVQDVFAIEASGGYKGVYHVLDGAISPLEGIKPEHLHIKELLQRVKGGGIKEVIIATSGTLAGEATAAHLTQLLREEEVMVSRLAYGIPVGAEMAYVDELTVAKAIEGRVPVKGGKDVTD
jgi:recombination protein RecR